MTVGSMTVGRTIVARVGFCCTGVALLLSGCTVESAELRPATAAGALSVYQADLFYQTIGTGQPIVVVHGGPGLDHAYLRRWLEPLAESYKVIFYDQRGVGGSSAVLDTASISIGRYLTDLDRIRERVAERERITIMAHSWGAIPALLYALAEPERVESLILVDPVEPGSRFEEETNARAAARRDPVDQRAIDSLVATPGFRDNDLATLNQMFFHVFRGTFSDPAIADSLLQLNLHSRTAQQGQRVARLLMTPLLGLDFWDDLPTLDVPVLIVHGDSDPIPLEMVQALSEALPRSELAVIENAGHFPFIEQPGAFFAAVQQYLDAIEPGP